MCSGRPSGGPFQEACARTKKGWTWKLRTEVPTKQLTFAANKIDTSKIIKDITSNLSLATKYIKTFRTLQNKTEKLTPVESLSIFVEAGLTGNQYEIARSSVKSIYLCYSLIQKECYPSKNSYQVTQTSIEINLRDLA
ncbi:hypothetical protein AVEN_169637-1 [Araneus ventricosus]|uniref:Uncharacterized protein n=1 Tax=Araneus ventricosus TaxID=182803 RepID=A0A4Y2E844_ARAVE|nr:hypothetical protein AVEN_10552-1 [Araneus ventricosus]GBM25187.1 hypothetical protein AVEN_169637-1 [Araneus ventricosus]